MRRGVHIGCSGWSYEKDWMDVFYSSKESLLQQYLAVFDTTEINSTFYSLPQQKFIRYLAESISSDKFFTVKIPKKVTHDSRLRLTDESREVLARFFQLLRPIHDRIEALLIQLPPWNINTMGDLETFLSYLDTNFRYAIEFRHESWLHQQIWELLENYQIAYVIVDEPRLPVNIRVTADFTYVRWHGHGQDLWYNYLYSVDELRPWVGWLRELSDLVDTTLGYFNNHLFGNAPLNALQMLDLLGKINARQRIKLELILQKKRLVQTSLDDFLE